jgi:predicted Zn finger-like uncharacterized protein
MLLNCNSCQKKFVVPDNAVTISGRLVQCGSCGNKWTQYPVEKSVSKKTDTKEKIKLNTQKNFSKKPKLKKNLYTAEYLQKKHGLIINESNDVKRSKLPTSQRKKNSFGFYSYIFFLFVFLITFFGILELSKETIILKYPILEAYINYLYEVIEIIKISFTQFIK